MSVLTIEGLTKRYGKITAVDLPEPGGGWHVLRHPLPNGSGRPQPWASSWALFIKLPAAFCLSGGRLRKWHRHHIGALLETPNFYPYLNAVDNLRLIAHIRREEPRIDYLLELVNLHRRATPNSGLFSGHETALAIAAAMVGDPRC